MWPATYNFLHYLGARDYEGKRVNPHIGPLTKVIPLKLFLDMVPSSSADITHALRGYFREESVYMYVVSFCFVSKQRKTSNAVRMSSFIFRLQAWEPRLSVCFKTFRYLNRSLNRRRMSPAQKANNTPTE